jgi:predicted transcriptional regulator
MATPYRLQEVAKKKGKLNKLIPRLLNKYGTEKAVAEELGVSQATINHWIRANGYVRVVRFEKKEQAS